MFHLMVYLQVYISILLVMWFSLRFSPAKVTTSNYVFGAPLGALLTTGMFWCVQQAFKFMGVG